MPLKRIRIARHVVGVQVGLAVASLGFPGAAAAGALPGSASGLVSFTMPAAGHATLAIDTTNGIRVRNLVSDLPFAAGPQSVEWDGRDDDGALVAPGQYRWTGLTRGDLHAVYRGAFQYGDPPWLYGKTGGWTSDHCYPVTAVAVGERVLIGSTEAEWGHGLIATDLDGRKQWGIRWLDKRAWCGADSLAAIGERVFASSYVNECAIWEVDPATGENWLVLEKKDLPADGAVPALRVIGGRAAGDEPGELYAADLSGNAPRTWVFAPGKRGERLRLLRTLAVRPAALAWLPDGRCVAAMERTVDLLDTQTGRTTPWVTNGISAPWGLAVDRAGRVYVSDQGDTGDFRFTRFGQLPWHYRCLDGASSQQVKVFAADGRLLRALGTAGGQQPGVIDPMAFYRPAGLAIDARDRLWVTELTFAPKRVSVWTFPSDPKAAPTLVREFFGPAAYGGGAFMPDPKQPWRIMDSVYGVLFEVDLPSGAYKPVELPWRSYDSWKQHGFRPDLPFMGRPGIVFDVDGRRFAACSGGYGHSEGSWEPYRFGATGPVMIGEYRDRVFVPRAAIGNLRMWMRARELDSRREEQWLPPVILEAARRLPDWPAHAAAMKMDPAAADVPHSTHARGSSVWIAHPWPKAISGFLWVDGNGDCRLQADEITFHAFEDAETVVLDRDLNAYLPVPERFGGGVFQLPRDGFNACGAPVYRWDRLVKARRDYVDLRHVGADGSWLAPTALYRADGTRAWSYPASPKATKELGANKRDVLTPGRIYRVNALRGVVPGPGDLGDVYGLNSVDGMAYLLTRRDGLFIGTLFRPAAFAQGWDGIAEAKPGLVLDDYSLQEECFGGSLARAEADGHGFEKGHYYLLGLARSAVVELTGLDTVRRFEGGTVTLAAGEGLYGRGQRFDPAAVASGLVVKPLPKTPLVALHIRPGIDAFASTPVEFGASTVWAAWDDRGLHLKWWVRGDATPFINNESDWTRLFATGDACDLQLASPTLGKCRYVFAMHGSTPVVVRLRYEGADTPSAVTYRSGVAETHVPAVERLDLTYRVKRSQDGCVVQATLPWPVLGLAPAAGLKVALELGQMSSDPTGTKTIAREYWHSGMNGMVADLPTEAALTTDWGELELK